MYGSKTQAFDARAIFGFVFLWITGIALTPLFTRHGFSGPDLLVLAVFLFGVARGSSAGQYAGFLVGLAIDLISTGIPGPLAASYLIAGYFGGWIFENRESRRAVGILALPLILAASDLTALLLFRLSGMIWPISAEATFFRLLSTLCALPFVWWIHQPLGLGGRNWRAEPIGRRAR